MLSLSLTQQSAKFHGGTLWSLFGYAALMMTLNCSCVMKFKPDMFYMKCSFPLIFGLLEQIMSSFDRELAEKLSHKLPTKMKICFID